MTNPQKSSPKRILALAPHPDDLEIGCAGTLAEHAARGDEVHIFVATYGDIGGAGETRKAEQQAASNILGVHKIHWGGFSDTSVKLQPMLNKTSAMANLATGSRNTRSSFEIVVIAKN